MRGHQKKIFIYQYSFLFTIGLVISFSVLMLLVSKLGYMLNVAPFWAYLAASISTLLVIFYSLGKFKNINKEKIAHRFLKYKLFGAIIIGFIFGIVSTPCASAPLITIITVAEQSGWAYSYLLVLTFAIGHASFLLLAGLSLGFTQSIVSNKLFRNLSKFVNAFFISFLLVISIYFMYKAYLIF